MEPGKTYVARLPGRSRPSFIRRKVQPPNLRFGFSAGTEKLVVPCAPPRSRSVEAAPQEIRVVSAPAPPTYAIAPPPQQLQLEHARGQPSTTAPQQTVEFVHAAPSQVPAPLVLEQQQPSSTVTAQVVRYHGRRHDIMLQHTCASCGKFRSPSYHHRHPLAPDEVPKLGICRKCMKVQTSSDESTEDGSRSRSRSRSREARRHKRSAKRTKHRERDRRTSSEERLPSVEEVVRVTRRTESRGSRERRRSESRRRRPSPSSSEGQAQIQVSYLSAKKNKAEPPAERVHVVDRIRYIEPPEPGRSRSESRAREVYEEDDEYVPVHRPTRQRRPIKYISYRQDDDRHIIRERPPTPIRAFSPRRPDTHLIQHEEAYHPREIGHRYRPRRISYGHIREPSRSSRDSFEHGYHADIPSRPPSRSVRVLRVHNRGSEDVIQDSWESDSADVGPPRVMFVSADHARRRSPVERHISEDIEPIRRRRRRRIRDIDDLILDRRSELSHVTGKSKQSSQPYLPPLVTNNSDVTQSTHSHHAATATCASPPHHPPNGVPNHKSDTYHHLHHSIAHTTTTSTTHSNTSTYPPRSALHRPADAHPLVLEAFLAVAVRRRIARRSIGMLRVTGRRKVKVIDP